MKICLNCEYETEEPGELYCKYCGKELVVKTSTNNGERKILVSIVDQDTILEMIRSDWGYAMNKAEEKVKAKKKEETEYETEEHFEGSWLTKKVEVAGITIKRISKSGESTEIIVTIANEDGGFRDTMFLKVLDEELVPDVWDDLTDILLLQCNGELKRKYMREFTVKDKPYAAKVRVLHKQKEFSP
jgi:hypothetical protein